LMSLSAAIKPFFRSLLADCGETLF
jgi:hypothetical protein